MPMQWLMEFKFLSALSVTKMFNSVQSGVQIYKKKTCRNQQVFYLNLNYYTLNMEMLFDVLSNHLTIEQVNYTMCIVGVIR